jgi:adenylate cyclase
MKRLIKISLKIKLMAVISAIVAVCLTLVIGLFTLLVSRDMRLNSEDNNFLINRRVAASADAVIANAVANADFLLETARDKRAMDYYTLFFKKNRDILAVAMPPSTFIVHEAFFLAYHIDRAAIEAFIIDHTEALGKAAWGQTQIVNATPQFQSPVIAVFFQQEKGSAAVVFLAYRAFEDFFPAGANSSLLINDSGEALISPDTNLLLAGANFSADPFVRVVLEAGEMSMQKIYTDNEGTVFFGAFQKLPEYSACVLTTIPAEIAFEGVYSIIRRNIYVSFIIFTVCVVFIWFWTRRITRPLKELSAAARRIEEGDYHIDINMHSGDEIGSLCESTRNLALVGQERDRLIDALGKFSNKSVIKRALRGRLSAGGRESEITVLCARLYSWTALAQEFEGSALVQVANMFFSIVFECVQKSGGSITSFSGGDLTAVWGAPEKIGDKKTNVHAALSAALNIREALAAYNESRRPLLSAGFGIDCGSAYCGYVGTKDRLEWTTAGLPVVNARWAEGENRRLGTDILITENTRKLGGKDFVYEKMPAVTVKGKQEVLESWALLGSAGAAQTLPELRDQLDFQGTEYGRGV